MKGKQSVIRTAMRVSVIEGIYAQIHQSLTGIGSAFITKTAVLLNASPLQFSILTGISQLCQFFQLYAVMHNRNVTSRKKPCIQYAFWGRLLNVLLGLSFAIVNPTLALYFFLTLLFFSAALQSISGNMWVAWMSDLIPKQVRGRFFSRRMQIHLIFGLAAGYIFSFFVDLFEATAGSFKYTLVKSLNLQSIFNTDNLPIGIAVIFVIGAGVGLYGLKLLGRQEEIRPQKKDLRQQNPDTSIPNTENQTRTIENKPQTTSLFAPLKDKDFRSLLRFGIWWMFAIGVGSAFWGPFMLKVLKMSLVEMQIYGMLSAVGMVLSYRFWGRFIDKFGNKTAMRICVFIGAINPMMWLFMQESNYALIFIEGFTSGVMWSGANLIAFNFVLAIAPRGDEQHWSALYAAIGGVVMLTTILLSGIFFPPTLVIDIPKWFSGSMMTSSLKVILLPEQVLFALTGILRLSAEIPLYFVNESKAVGLRKTIKNLIKNK